jgi:hypothetical protein
MPTNSSQTKKYATSVKAALPEILIHLQSNFGLLTGKNIQIHPTKKDMADIGRAVDGSANILEELEKQQTSPITPEAAAVIIARWNDLFRIVCDDIPKDYEPVDYLVQQMREICKPSPDLVSLRVFNYIAKQEAVEHFVKSVVKSVSIEEVKSFIHSGLRKKQLIPQIQGAFIKNSLPKELRVKPTRSTVRSADRVKVGLRLVLADWEAWLNLIYGLTQLEQKQNPKWTKIRKGALWNKASAIRKDRRLSRLAQINWVTVRNALDHGSALFNPVKGTIEFRDRRRKVSWSVDNAWRNGVDVFLANVAMMYTFNFAQTADVSDFETLVRVLRNHALSAPPTS